MFTKLISLLWIILLLTSCYSNPKDLEKIEELENKVSKLESSIWEKDLFWKKQECLAYKNDIYNFALSYDSDIWNIEEIFYSPSEESCFFIANKLYKYDLWERNIKMIFDYLNQKMIKEAAMNQEWWFLMEDNWFEEKISELKSL